MELDASADAGLVRRIFDRSGRVHIAGILKPDAAKAVFSCLAEQTPWQLSIHDDQGPHDISARSFEQIEPSLRAELSHRVDRAAARGFAYRFSNCRIDTAEDARTVPLILRRFHEFLNSPPLLQFARVATGFDDITFADAQATLYNPGDFLTCHDDDVKGKNRRVAYVFNFTPLWRVEWGGLLAFPDAYGHLHEAFTPAFNAVNLMRVPMVHTVTQVATFAAAGRYSVTGWFRAS
jgi:Rps23 Pro-64 3,4-dihydroxylase Tpa1-like proline 4-hydroxylase